MFGRYAIREMMKKRTEMQGNGFFLKFLELYDKNEELTIIWYPKMSVKFH